MQKKKIDLKNLSREEKLKLLDVLEEKKRREMEKASPYVPHEGQLKVHLSTATERFVTYGNGAGKTAMLVNECIAAALGYNPWLKEYTNVPAKICVVLDSPQKVDEVWLPEIKKWYPLKPEQLQKRGKPYVSAIVFPNGSQVIFYFFNQDPMIFESIETSFVISDEPIGYPQYVALFLRGSRTKGTKPKFLQAGTPIAASWIRTKIVEPWERGEFPPGQIECFKGSTHMNRANLAEGYIERMESRLSEKERAIRLQGEFFDLSGLALSHLWDRKIHVLSKEKSEEIRASFIANKWPCVISVDPHPSKACTAVLMGKDSSGYTYVIDELRRKLVPTDFATELKDWMAEYKVVDVIVDSLGSADFTGGEGFKSFIQVLNECGIRSRSTTFKEKSDEDFIERIQDALVIRESGKPKLFMLQWCIGSITDVEGVSWVTGKNANGDILKPKLGIDNRDYLAAIKYGLASGVANKHFGRTRIVDHTGGKINILQRQKKR